MTAYSSARAPTSTPRVGSSSSSTRQPRSSQRARTAFCWLPPERVRTGTDGLSGRSDSSRVAALRRAQLGAPVDPAGACEAGQGGHRDVAGDGLQHEQGLRLALLGGQPDSGADGGPYAAGASPAGRRRGRDRRRACGRRRSSPGSRSGRSRRVRRGRRSRRAARTRSNGSNSPSRASPRTSSTGSRSAGCRAGRSGKTYSTFAAGHQGDDLAGRGRLRGQAAVPPPGRPSGRSRGRRCGGSPPAGARCRRRRRPRR